MRFPLILAILILSCNCASNSDESESLAKLLAAAQKHVENGQLPNIPGMDEESIMQLAKSAFKDDDIKEKMKTILNQFQVKKKCHYRCSNRKQNANFTPVLDGCTSLSTTDENNIKTEFSDCCNVKNTCYGNCGKKKDECDTQFLGCMRDLCSHSFKQQLDSTIIDKTDYTDQIITDHISLQDITQTPTDGPHGLKACLIQAKAIYQVARIVGCNSFKDSQKQACICQNDEL